MDRRLAAAVTQSGVCMGESIEIVSEYIIYVRQHGFESRP